MARDAGPAYAPPKGRRSPAARSLDSGDTPCVVTACSSSSPLSPSWPRSHRRPAAGPSAQRPATVADTLNAYRVKATAENLRALALAGYDVTEGRDLERGTVDVVGYGSDLARFNGRQLSSYRAAPARTTGPQAAPTDGASDADLDRLDEVRRGARRRQGAVHRDV